MTEQELIELRTGQRLSDPEFCQVEYASGGLGLRWVCVLPFHESSEHWFVHRELVEVTP